MKSRYNSELLKLNLKKERLWTQSDMTKWEMDEDNEKIDKNMLLKDKNMAFRKMCHKETVLLGNYHKRLGFYNRQCIEELKNVVENQSTRFRTNTQKFVDIFYPSLTDVKLLLC